NSSNLMGGITVSAVTDHLVSAGDRHIDDGQTINGDATRDEIGRHQPGPEPRGPQASGGFVPVKLTVHRPGWIDRPMRGPHALDPASFLIDEDRAIRAVDFSKVFNQLFELM